DSMCLRPHIGFGVSFPDGYKPNSVKPSSTSSSQSTQKPGDQQESTPPWEGSNQQNQPTIGQHYQIPYFHVDGRINPSFYRIKLISTPTPTSSSIYNSQVPTNQRSAQDKRPAPGSPGKPPKYLQSIDEANHVYIPPNWLDLSFRPFTINKADKFARALSETVIITEGEKKAASLAMVGLSALGLGGIDSWRTSRIEATKADVVKIDKSSNRIVLNAENLLEKLRESVAEEFSDSTLISTIRNKNIFIIFDSEPQVSLSSLPKDHQESIAPYYNGKYTKDQISRAAFELGIFLASKGCENVYFAELPRLPSFSSGVGVYQKFAVDDVIYHYSKIENLKNDQICEKFLDFLYPPNEKLPLGWRCTEADQDLYTPFSFPTINNVKAWINTKLNNQARVNRSDRLKIAQAIVSHLDTNGRRYRDSVESHKYYYFHSKTRILHSVDTLSQSDSKMIIRSNFGDFISKNFNLLSSDSAVVSDVIDQMMHSKGVSSVDTHRLLHSDNDSIYYQLSNTYFVKISAESIEIRPNGYGGVLFSEMEVELKESDIVKLTELISNFSSSDSFGSSDISNPGNLWKAAISTMNLQVISGLTIEETRQFLVALFYINPWLNRWRGTMMPMELAVAEPGSGKSMLYNLRQG
ncbi:MAG: DUF3854 domain-containing protein, partial [Waterburya sp.]